MAAARSLSTDFERGRSGPAFAAAPRPARGAAALALGAAVAFLGASSSFGGSFSSPPRPRLEMLRPRLPPISERAFASSAAFSAMDFRGGGPVRSPGGVLGPSSSLAAGFLAGVRRAVERRPAALALVLAALGRLCA